MFSVHVCPSNQTEIDESSRRIGCGKDKYGNTQYMCISNGNKTSLVEFCFNGTMGLEEKGHCLEAVGGNIIRYNCSKFLTGCPESHFHKYDFYKYDACKNIDPLHHCYVLEPSCQPSVPSEETLIFSSVFYAYLIIYAVCVLCIFLLIVKQRKKKLETGQPATTSKNKGQHATISKEIDDEELRIDLNNGSSAKVKIGDRVSIYHNVRLSKLKANKWGKRDTIHTFSCSKVSEIYIELFNNSKATVKMDGKMHFYKLVSPHIDKNTTTLIFHKDNPELMETNTKS